MDDRVAPADRIFLAHSPDAGYVDKSRPRGGASASLCVVTLTPVDLAEVAAALAIDQGGVVSRSQLLAAGLTSSRARRDIATARWRRLLPGVYATFTGPVPPVARVWAAVLYAGPGAAAARRTALWLAGALDQPPTAVQVAVPAARRVHPQPGVRILRSGELSVRAPVGSPPRMRVESALLDQIRLETGSGVVDLVLRSVQRRTTTDRSGYARRSTPGPGSAGARS